jgi:hypothetical protein
VSKDKVVVAVMKRVAAQSGGKLPQGTQAQLCRLYGFSKARMSSLARRAGIDVAKGGRPSVEDEAAVKKLQLAASAADEVAGAVQLQDPSSPILRAPDHVATPDTSEPSDKPMARSRGRR